MLFALYLGGFGATLMAQPSMYFAGGALPYWTTECNDSCDIQNRLFGSMLTAIAIMAFSHGGEALVKKLIFYSFFLSLGLIGEAQPGPPTAGVDV